jgi:hypothetical protein
MVKSRVLEMATSLMDRVEVEARGKAKSLDKRWEVAGSRPEGGKSESISSRTINLESVSVKDSFKGDLQITVQSLNMVDHTGLCLSTSKFLS